MASKSMWSVTGSVTRLVIMENVDDYMRRVVPKTASSFGWAKNPLEQIADLVHSFLTPFAALPLSLYNLAKAWSSQTTALGLLSRNLFDLHCPERMHKPLLYLFLLGAASVTMLASPTPAVIDDGHDLNQVPAFNVTNFEASAMVLSNRNFYKFDVTFYHKATPVHCEALGTTINHKLTSIPQTWCPSPAGPGDGKYGNDTNQDNSNSTSTNDNSSTGLSVSFKWTEQPDGSAALLIVRRINDKAADTAVYKVTADCIPMMGEDIFRHQVYEGPENFSVPAYRSSQFN